jgi:threonine dehydrogenase-like Zn-dependent dehydrogenase
MRAVGVFPATREVRMIEHAEPRVASPREVKLRMLEVGVCGTDRDLCGFKFGTAPKGCDHFVLGHESLAEVVDAGDAVSKLKKGDLVVAVVRKPCNDAACPACRAGRQDFCLTGRYRERGIQGMHGFMTEYVVDEEKYVYPIAPELREVAVLVEPLTIAEKAYLEYQAIDARLPWRKGRRTALVLGAGPVGILGAMLFRSRGFQTWVYSRAPAANAAILEAAGAHFISPLDATPREFAKLAGNIDVVYEAMGAPQAAFDFLECLGGNGVFIFTGVPPVAENLTLDLHQLLFHMIVRNQVIVGTVNAGPDAFEAAIRDLGTFHTLWPRALASMISQRYPLEAFGCAIHDPGIKNVLLPG